MNTPHMIRLHLFFATENDRAVILRQGPSRQYRMILWHRDSDRFEEGQWVRNRVYADRCALSPDGSHFLYFALDGRWGSDAKGSFSAISRPPYWTALALFPQGDTWGGGGVFIDNTHYWTYGDADNIGRDEGLARVHLGEPDKGCSSGLRLVNGQRAPLSREATRRILADPHPKTQRDVFERMVPPHSDALDRYDTMGGKLYRRHGQALELIRDFTDMDFEPIRAPYDWRPETPDAATAPWHPLGNKR